MTTNQLITLVLSLNLRVCHPRHLGHNNSPMKTLAKVLLRLEGLSHVLAWTRDPVLACKDAAALHFVELPRLRLRFEAKVDGPGGKVRYIFFSVSLFWGGF